MLLSRKNNTLCCDNGHGFDIAKQGYVNLLPVQYKKSKAPGDSKEMIAARHRFLNSGLYDQISTELNGFVENILVEKKQANILDAGCGEGFYLDACLHHMKEIYPEKKIACLGLDISKPAILAATKRTKHISWVIGTNKMPPILPESIDIILCMFGFCDLSILATKLKPGGYVVQVDPGPGHLLALRKILYSHIKDSISRSVAEGYALINQLQLQYNIELNKDQIADLLLMTPHLFRASKQGKDAVFKLDSLDVGVDVIFRLLQKN